MPLLTGERGDQEDNRRREDQRDLREDVSDRHFSLPRPAPPLPIRQPTAAKSDRRQWRPLETAAPRAPKPRHRPSPCTPTSEPAARRTIAAAPCPGPRSQETHIRRTHL